MNRRELFGALFTAVAAPVAPNRVYSFLWGNPLVQVFQPADVWEPLDLKDLGPSELFTLTDPTTGELRYNGQRNRDV